MDRQRFKDCARGYIELGWKVIPLCYPDKGKCTCGRGCEKPGKAPHYRLCPQGSKQGTTDAATVDSWFALKERFNLGIVAGEQSGIVIVDVDIDKGGKASWAKLTGGKKQETPTVETGSGGGHFYYKHPGGNVRNSAGTIGDGVDVRGKHGYCVAPPSMHPCGKEYRWRIDPRAPLAAMPAWVNNSKANKAADIAGDAEIPNGKRDDSLVKIAGRLRRGGATTEDIYTHLTIVNENRCKPPKDDAALRRIAASVGQYEPDKDAADEDIIILPNNHPDTIAAAFEQWQNSMGIYHRYHHMDGWSMARNSRYQKINEEEKLARYVRQFIGKVRFTKNKKIDGQWKEIAVTPDKTDKSKSNVANIIEYVKGLPGVYLYDKQAAPCSLDGTLDPSRVIAMNNGLLDISNPDNPQLLEHTPDFYTFNYLPYDYDPGATCPTWDWALGQYFNNDDGTVDTLVPNILHSWIKKWLLRDTSHHKIFAIIGQRRSGKSSIGRVVNRLIGGDNVASITISQLAKNFGLQPLLNKQLGILWDASVGGRASATLEAVEMLKCISGCDPVSVDRKNKERLDNITLPMSILIICNKVMDLQDSTGALAGRFTFLETTGSFYGQEDPSVETKMHKELSGIFNRVLKAPEGRVMEHPKSLSTQQSFEELSSPYIAFINEWCEINDEQFIPADVAWFYYCAWTKKNGHKEPSKQKFKIEFANSHKDIKKDFRPRLDYKKEAEMEEQYHLSEAYGLDAEAEKDKNLSIDFRRARSIKIGTRPHCYRGINITEDFLDAWTRT